ncbi:MAG: hypothetical protein KDE47_12850, partial [Caldilineaceae bacterium]|nr:hypothetical protein [Caldilineaceae bacterium]
MAFANRYDETVNTGTWVAGAAGLAASGLAVAFIAEGLLDSRLVMILCLSAMTGATISMALLWRWL